MLTRSIARWHEQRTHKARAKRYSLAHLARPCNAPTRRPSDPSAQSTEAIELSALPPYHHTCATCTAHTTEHTQRIDAPCESREDQAAAGDPYDSSSANQRSRPSAPATLLPRTKSSRSGRRTRRHLTLPPDAISVTAPTHRTISVTAPSRRQRRRQRRRRRRRRPRPRWRRRRRRR